MAEADLIERARYYRRNAGDEVAARLFDTVIDALHAIERMPGIGSPRVGERCDIPGLRVRRIPGFPCDWFYVTHPEHLDVVRLLADSQDLAAILDDLTEE